MYRKHGLNAEYEGDEAEFDHIEHGQQKHQLITRVFQEFLLHHSYYYGNVEDLKM